MKYELFLFDLDDTLLDFRASEKLSFYLTLESFGIKTDLDRIYQQYQLENAALWKLFEQAKTTKDHLKVERFRRIFEANGFTHSPETASARYLDALPETVVLIDDAVEICQWLSEKGELGIITNGIQSVQARRIQNSKLAPFISFVAVSDECGHAKPDARFFEYTVKRAKSFRKESTLIVGDRPEADIQGAMNFGIDSCWFNQHGLSIDPSLRPTFEISALRQLREVLS